MKGMYEVVLVNLSILCVKVLRVSFFLRNCVDEYNEALGLLIEEYINTNKQYGMNVSFDTSLVRDLNGSGCIWTLNLYFKIIKD
jgi:hypothetical protein